MNAMQSSFQFVGFAREKEANWSKGPSPSAPEEDHAKPEDVQAVPGPSVLEWDKPRETGQCPSPYIDLWAMFPGTRLVACLVCQDTNTIHPAILTRLVFYMEACDSGSNGPGLVFFRKRAKPWKSKMSPRMYMSHELSSSMGWMCVFSLKSPYLSMTIVWVLNSEIGTKSSENSMHWFLNHFFMLHLLPLAHNYQCHCEGVLWALRREWLYVPWLDPGWQDSGSHRLQRPVFCLWKICLLSD